MEYNYFTFLSSFKILDERTIKNMYQKIFGEH